ANAESAWARTVTPRTSTCCGRYPTVAPRGSATAPASGSRSPAMMRRSVDLPAPFGPVSPTRAPSGTPHVTSPRTICPPYRLAMPERFSMRTVQLAQPRRAGQRTRGGAHRGARDEQHEIGLERVAEPRLGVCRGVDQRAVDQQRVDRQQIAPAVAEKERGTECHD